MTIPEIPDEKAVQKAAKAVEKAAKKAERAANRKVRSEKRQQWLADHANDAMLSEASLRGRTLRCRFKKHDVAGAKAEFQHGANVGSRLTLTRVALVGIFALGVKKDQNKVYVLVELPDGEQELIEAKANEETKARKFANAVNKAGVYFAKQ